jgi:4-diphosphocytidyl-2-C-methyl-D-erythritol kinase
MPPLSLNAQAGAKLNLALHVQSRRADGYHLLETCIVFTEFGDQLCFEAADSLSLTLKGPFADLVEADADNLVLRAARALQLQVNTAKGVHITLEKNIPVGAGLGGGSADAACTLKMLRALWGVAISDEKLAIIAAGLGADIPACLHEAPLIAHHIGEVLTPVTGLIPDLYVVLVYPNMLLETKRVFAALDASAYSDIDITKAIAQEGFLPGLVRCKNNLQQAAIANCAEIAEILLTLERSVFQPDLVRMSGSGSCCFALFKQEEQAKEAEADIKKRHPNWWVTFSKIRTN